MKSFHRISRVLFMLAIFSLCFGGSASAALIGLTPSYPDLFANSTGTYTYNESSELFTITALPNKLSYSATPTNFDFISAPTTGTWGYTAQINVDHSGDFLSSGSENDLFIYGKVGNGTNGDGLLLEGKITDFGWSDLIKVGGGLYQIFDFTFDVTVGDLADSFGSYGGAIVFSEKSGFGNSWNENFSGSFVKVDNFPIPIPATVWIFGAGLVGLVGIRRKLKS